MRNFLKTLAACLTLGLAGGGAHAAEPLAEGDDAPTPKAIDQEGETVDFKELYGKGKTLVYFFPKAMTPG